MAKLAMVVFLLGGILAIVGVIGKTKNLPWAKPLLTGGLAACGIGLVIGIIMKLTGG